MLTRGAIGEQEMSFRVGALRFSKELCVRVSCMKNEMHQHGNAAASTGQRSWSFVSCVTQTNFNVSQFYDRNMIGEMKFFSIRRKCTRKKIAALVVGGPRDERVKNTIFSAGIWNSARHLENVGELLKQKCRGHVIQRLQYFLFHLALQAKQKKGRNLNDNKAKLFAGF